MMIIAGEAVGDGGTLGYSVAVQRRGGLIRLAAGAPNTGLPKTKVYDFVPGAGSPSTALKVIAEIVGEQNDSAGESIARLGVDGTAAPSQRFAYRR